METLRKQVSLQQNRLLLQLAPVRTASISQAPPEAIGCAGLRGGSQTNSENSPNFANFFSNISIDLCQREAPPAKPGPPRRFAANKKHAFFNRWPATGFYLPQGNGSRTACGAKGPRLRRRQAARNSHQGELRKRQQLADAGLSVPVGPTRKDLRNACT